MVGVVFLGSKSALFFLQTLRVELMPKSSILVSSDLSTSSQPSSELSRCFFANFRRAGICPFLSRRTLQALQDFSPLRRGVLLMAILLTVLPAALRSSTRSCYVVLVCSLIFLIIRFTPRWEILRGTPDRGRFIVNRCFFHVLIIAPTVNSFSPSCLPIVL